MENVYHEKTMHSLFTKMMPKGKKEAPVPSKAKVKVREKALKAQKAVLKGVHSHTHTQSDLYITQVQWSETLLPQRQPEYPQ